MADQPKRKNPNAVTKNDARANGKASKSGPTSVFRGKSGFRGSHTRGVTLTEVEKVNLGRGILSYYRPLTKDEADTYSSTRVKRGGRW